MLVHGQNWAPVRKIEQAFPYMLPLFMLFQAQAPCVLARPLKPPGAVSNSCGEPVRTGIPDAAAFSQHIRADFPSAFRWQDNHGWKAEERLSSR